MPRVLEEHTPDELAEMMAYLIERGRLEKEAFDSAQQKSDQSHGRYRVSY